MILGRLVNEKMALESLHYNMKIIGWDDFTFYPDGFAANSTLLYLLFKIYQLVEPKKILELGSGQSTLFTNRYLEENSEVQADVLEDQKEWYEIFKDKINQNERLRYILAPLTSIKVGKKEFQWYGTDIFINENRKYDLIIIDGPAGTKRNSRIGLLKYLPKILNKEDFILLFDDTARIGEIDTIKKTKKILKKNNIDFSIFNRYGSKKQTCLCSKNYGYFESC
jgi:hypothetical protein